MSVIVDACNVWRKKSSNSNYNGSNITNWHQPIKINLICDLHCLFFRLLLHLHFFRGFVVVDTQLGCIDIKKKLESSATKFEMNTHLIQIKRYFFLRIFLNIPIKFSIFRWHCTLKLFLIFLVLCLPFFFNVSSNHSIRICETWQIILWFATTARHHQHPHTQEISKIYILFKRA